MLDVIIGVGFIRCPADIIPMSYKVVQKIRNNYYLYEVTAQWDPLTKKSKQKRTYLGKCDKDGNPETVKEISVSSKSLGEYYLLHRICIRCGLWDALCKVYGEETAIFLFSHCACRVTRSYPPSQSSYGVKNSILPEFFGIEKDSESFSLAGYMKLLIGVYERRQSLFAELSDGREAVIFEQDVTRSPINYYKTAGMDSSYTFNSFPQKSLLVARGTETKLPFYFRWSNNSSTDPSTLRNVSDELKEMGVTGSVFYLNNKNFTLGDIESFSSCNHRLIVKLSHSSELYRSFVSGEEENDGFDTVFFDNGLYKYKTRDISVGHYPYRMYAVTNLKARNEGLTAFYKSLSAFKETVSKMKWSKTIEERIGLNTELKDLRRYFRLDKNAENGTVSVVLNQKEIQKTDFDIGKDVYLSDSDYEIEKILDQSQIYNQVEQDLSIFLMDLQIGAAVFPSNEAALASIAGDFLAWIIKSSLIDNVHHSELGERTNYLDVISEVSQIRCYRINGEMVIPPMTSNQTKIFESLGMQCPSKELYPDGFRK